MAEDPPKDLKKFLDLDVDVNAFEALEREVQEVREETFERKMSPGHSRLWPIYINRDIY